MENNETKKESSSMEERVLEQIRADKLSMHSKFYYTLKLVALIVVGSGVLLISILIFNFIFFTVRISGHNSLLGFGPRGFWVYLQLFPWMLFILDLILIGLLEWLLRQFRFGYKSPVLYLLLAVLALSASIGLAVDRSSDINDRLLNQADQHRLPEVFGNVFRGARQLHAPADGVCRCTITAIEGNVLTVDDKDDGKMISYKVVVPPNEAQATTTSLKVGDVVFIVGSVKNGVIQAFGIHPYSSGELEHENFGPNGENEINND